MVKTRIVMNKTWKGEINVQRNHIYFPLSLFIVEGRRNKNETEAEKFKELLEMSLHPCHICIPTNDIHMSDFHTITDETNDEICSTLYTFSR